MSFEYNEQKVKRIAKAAESPAIKGAAGYISFLRYHSKEKCFCFIVDDTAFLFGTFAKNHFRLSEIAVEKSNQKKGYGSFMLSLLFEECAKRGISTITLRTSKQEKAHLWYKKLGAEYTGTKGDDYEMRFVI